MLFEANPSPSARAEEFAAAFDTVHLIGGPASAYVL